MPDNLKFVTAFRGRRDDYQIPLALAERDMLAGFVTDIYATPTVKKLGILLPRLRPMLDFRYKSGIPHDKIAIKPSMALREFLARSYPIRAESIRDRHDDILSLSAASTARRTNANLLMYSAYAGPAFRASYSHAPKKILFQYHPHCATEYAILNEDNERFGLVGEAAIERELDVISPHRLRSDEVFRNADHIVCASSFTAGTLVDAGADPQCISVIGYGVAEQKRRRPPPAPDAFKVLFVGSGFQRKGVHHLIHAWRRAKLPATASLTIVARTFDKTLMKGSSLPEGVQILPALSAESLIEAYRSSTLFCMPSLIEGFGQVFLEALNEGLPVLGTRNTCLPDLGNEIDGIFLTEPGDIEALSVQLQRLCDLLPGNSALKEAAALAASRYNWGSFRKRIEETCVMIAASGKARNSSGH